MRRIYLYAERHVCALLNLAEAGEESVRFPGPYVTFGRVLRVTLAERGAFVS